MTHRCLNHRNLTYDICRTCNGKMLECPEYLSDIEHTRQTKPLDTVKTDDGLIRTSLTAKALESKDKPAENYSTPVQYRRLTIMEAQATTRHFLNRFYRSQK